MNAFDLYLLGWETVFNPNVLIFLTIGTITGVIIGALPGLTATMSVAILTPLTFGMSFHASFALLLGSYCGAVYGGSMTAIMAKIPGTPASMMTSLDGYPMCLRGEAGKAVGYATVSSFIGGILSVIALSIFAPMIAKFALKFSAEEYFMVSIFGLSILAYISPGSMIKGLISGMLGILVATIGMDPINAYPRFTMGMAELMTGLEYMPIIIGIFGLANVFYVIENVFGGAKVVQKIDRVLLTIKEIKGVLPTIFRGSAIGTFIGALPAVGGVMAAIVTYGVEKRISKHPERFGTGTPEGIAGPESANNAATGGAMIPMLTLGIPGDPVTAILIGALMIHGLRPGPMLFTEHPDLVSAIFILMALANVLFLFIGLVGAKAIAKLMDLPYGMLFPPIALFCVVGTYAIRRSFFDVAVLFIFGFIGYIFEKIKVPVPPFVLGFILTPLLESNLRRALLMSGGNLTTFFTRPISLTFFIATIVTLILPYIIKHLFKKEFFK